ncbi:ferredoxin family protein [Bradyrhizobium sp. U87765 SZCCT0131]|uniref:4Fe-4S dicluster domain-containing protein n=1 Tax=unclassified Bradyrhizobium TaxID=2631580 RepID=UPI001BA55C80|nr:MULTISPECIES: ferredoxin family protein [unclassified Bradyrhizobium]MBR1218900.1 ferredoxin family protein [Bradyrhizobium sp. U87765 SZCCT0131]MBR1261551.1 ferredoxin family protein [Bradyrhizobium sp. U87765 SZCCT0134]MBR1306596.1 ferredoxin family protein [Bradyrhizobium sp. U87765 SZCCT0110]MBR1317333.1 ferredoxin family protein [Bradyrhizobium sp. U87765 SZCCT0109]MBR1351035.1 ferredoxin family protein [Bradyrhizobium sp. U87765 SZCCT0048]
MIEVIDAERCTSCNICVSACPTNVFDKTDGLPVIARQGDCQTCFLCELYCPEDALFVSPYADAPHPVDVVALRQGELLGSYRRAVGWADGTRGQRDADRSYQLFGH